MKTWTHTFTDFIDTLIELDERPKGISFERFKEIARGHAGDDPASRLAAKNMVTDYPWDAVDAMDLQDIYGHSVDCNPWNERTQPGHLYLETIESIYDKALTEIENA